jgi:rod shape-determining protein MreC
MESFFSRYKNALVLILVLLAQVIGVAVQVRRPLPREHAQPDAGGVRLIRYWAISLVSPPERLVHWLGTSILGVWDNYLDLIHVRQQNKDLEAELRRLRIEQGGIAEDARQGQRLQQLLAFKEKYVYQTMPAQIIGTSGTEQSRILSIDKGAKDGIVVDMPVITPDGIVGRIREVFPHTSQVLEITDPTSGAGVILSTTRIRGILRGNALGQPQVVRVMPDDRIKEGEPVVTSGGDQIFPRGLAVGVVDRVVVDPEHDPLVDVLIRPAANLSQLEEVLIITNMGDQVTPKQKLDMIQSEAAANAEQLKASEVLAERLPTRIDPDAPKTDDENSDDSADAEGEGIARPMRPPSALHPDRFTPNTTPTAESLMPGARLAPQSEGVLPTAAKPHVKAPSNDSDDTTQTADDVPKKKTPELVPDDGSRPPAAMTTRPAVSTATGAGTPRPSTAAGGTASASRPVANGEDTPTGTPVHATRPPATVTPGTTPTATRSVTNGEGSAAGVPVHAARPSAPVAAGTPAAIRSVPNNEASAASTAAHTTSPRTTTSADGGNVTAAQPKTKVIVDGPLPSGGKKIAPPAATTPGQHTPTTNMQSQHAPPTTPVPTTQRPVTASPTQHKGPELVPDDGSKPPPTMAPKTVKPQPQTPAPQPQGNR